MVNADFVCCCIPLVNVGIYFVLFEQLAAGITAAVLTVASPTIVGSSVPNFSLWIFAICCFVVAGAQILGVIGVVQEKKGLFKVYTIVNTVAVLAAASTAATLILVSGLKRETAITDCQAEFYPPSTTNSSTSVAPLQDSAEKICQIFTIVDVSVMGGLWVLVASVQGYFLLVANKYKKEQTEDHTRYASMYSTKGGFPDAENIPLSSTRDGGAGDVWNARPSTDSLRSPTAGQYTHPMAGSAYDDNGQSAGGGYAPQAYGDQHQHQSAPGYGGGQHDGGGYSDQPYGVRQSYDGPRDPYAYGGGGGGEGGFVPPQHEGYGREEPNQAGQGAGGWDDGHQQYRR